MLVQHESEVVPAEKVLHAALVVAAAEELVSGHEFADVGDVDRARVGDLDDNAVLG